MSLAFGVKQRVQRWLDPKKACVLRLTSVLAVNNGVHDIMRSSISRRSKLVRGIEPFADVGPVFAPSDPGPHSQCRGTPASLEATSPVLYSSAEAATKGWTHQSCTLCEPMSTVSIDTNRGLPPNAMDFTPINTAPRSSSDGLYLLPRVSPSVQPYDTIPFFPTRITRPSPNDQPR